MLFGKSRLDRFDGSFIFPAGMGRTRWNLGRDLVCLCCNGDCLYVQDNNPCEYDPYYARCHLASQPMVSPAFRTMQR